MLSVFSVSNLNLRNELCNGRLPHVVKLLPTWRQSCREPVNQTHTRSTLGRLFAKSWKKKKPESFGLNSPSSISALDWNRASGCKTITQSSTAPQVNVIGPAFCHPYARERKDIWWSTKRNFSGENVWRKRDIKISPFRGINIPRPWQMVIKVPS